MQPKQKKMRRASFLSLAGLLAMGLIAGCGKPAAGPAKADSTAPSADVSSPAAEPAGPKADEQICFNCKGTGTIKCQAPGCQDGQVDCPGPCLKLDRGVWVHMNVAGHPPTDVWQKFYGANHSYEAYNQNHVGHVIMMQNGQAVDTGPCKICGGTGKVPCSVCKGTGKQVCPVCGGKKFIPISWTPANNPWLNNQPDVIRLTDGRVLFGKVVSTTGTDLLIKTRGGKWLHVTNAEVAPKPEGVSTNLVAP
jgi:anaerobic selenocysteine-containing dehydrogenase